MTKPKRSRVGICSSSPRDVLKQRQEWRSIVDTGLELADEIIRSAHCEGAIQMQYVNPKYEPFSDWASNYLGIGLFQV